VGGDLSPLTTTLSASDAQARRELAVAWMNRGHEFMRQGDSASLEASLDAYAQAVALLRPLVTPGRPVDSACANSLGAALMNRGQLLHRLHGIEQAAPALAAFDEAVETLAIIPVTANPWPRRNLAGTLLNRANLLLDLARLADAAVAARAALALSMAHERADVVDADLALKARRALCDAAGRLIVTPGADQESLAREASDLVDDAMALMRLWAGRGETAFAALAPRFFRYGAQLYRLHQPQFLAEFIRENLALAPESRAIALEIVDAALAERPGGYLTVGDPASERHLETWRELTALRTDLVA
jgi:hypothetical protein